MGKNAAYRKNMEFQKPGNDVEFTKPDMVRMIGSVLEFIHMSRIPALPINKFCNITSANDFIIIINNNKILKQQFIFTYWNSFIISLLIILI